MSDQKACKHTFLNEDGKTHQWLRKGVEVQLKGTLTMIPARYEGFDEEDGVHVFKQLDRPCWWRVDHESATRCLNRQILGIGNSFMGQITLVMPDKPDRLVKQDPIAAAIARGLAHQAPPARPSPNTKVNHWSIMTRLGEFNVTRFALEAGIKLTSAYTSLSSYVARGLIERIGTGFYRVKDVAGYGPQAGGEE